MADISNLIISYPDFKYNDVINPEQFDTNNTEIVLKVNELVSKLNTANANSETHKESADHDERYYTITEMNTLIEQFLRQAYMDMYDLQNFGDFGDVASSTASLDGGVFGDNTVNKVVDGGAFLYKGV